MCKVVVEVWKINCVACVGHMTLFELKRSVGCCILGMEQDQWQKKLPDIRTVSTLLRMAEAGAC